MIGGLIGRPVECSTGPGSPTPIADSSLLLRRAVWSSDLHRVDHPAEHPVGTLVDRETDVDLAEDLAGQVGQHGPHVAGADVDADDHPGGRVEGEQ